jgi:hypothetical protein
MSHEDSESVVAPLRLRVAIRRDVRRGADVPAVVDGIETRTGEAEAGYAAPSEGAKRKQQTNYVLLWWWFITPHVRERVPFLVVGTCWDPGSPTQMGTFGIQT